MTRLSKTVVRLSLNVATLCGLFWIAWYGYWLFTRQVSDPLLGALLFVSSIIGWLLFVSLLLSRYRRTFPSFKITVFGVLCLLVIFAYAGIEPLASYKSGLGNYWAEKRALDERRQATELAEMNSVGVSADYDFYKEYTALFNEFRRSNGAPPLSFSSELNRLAAKRATEVSQSGNFNHNGILVYNLGENIAMMAYSSDSAKSLINQWATSAGHRQNMLSAQYRRTGFAKSGKFAVQIFG